MSVIFVYLYSKEELGLHISLVSSLTTQLTTRLLSARHRSDEKGPAATDAVRIGAARGASLGSDNGGVRVGGEQVGR